VPSFTYKGVDTSGNLRSGQLDAADQAAAFDKLSNMGLTPISLAEGAKAEAWWLRDISLTGAAPKFPLSEVEVFFNMVATMSNAHLSPTRILQICADLARHRGLKLHIQAAAKRLQDGQSLAESLADDKERFSPRLLQMLDIGEKSNAVPAVALRIAASLKQERALKAEVRQALVYPCILLLMSAVVGAVLVFYLTPTLTPVFVSANAELPFVIRAMGGLRQFLLTSWPLLILSIVAASVILFGLRQRLAKLRDRMLQVLPFVGTALRDKDFLNFCTTLELMLSSGATLSDAIKVTESAVSLRSWKTQTQQLVSHVENGGSLSSGLATASLADAASFAMIRAAEDSNRLRDVLPSICTALEQRLKNKINQSVRLITPLMTLCIGVFIGAIIMSTIGAIMDLNNVMYE
jgi:type II secretory pathway component PulF